MADWSKPSFWRSIISSSFLKVAIPAATVVLVAAFAWMFLKSADEPRSETVSITGSETVNGEPRETDSAMEPQPPPVTETEGSPKPLIASLVDGGGRIELEQDGRITGLSTGKHDKRVRSALTHQTVDISADVRQLRTSTGVLMGPAADGRGFKLTAPIGKVIESQRPTLSWQPLKGAESYKVEIYDERFNRVAASPTIRTVRWTTNVTLKRGRVYQWQVTAIKDDQEIKSPVRPAPEAKFKVLDAAKANEIAEARRLAGNSNLLLGILYANAGLLDDAEREFQALLKKNPGSDIARKLLTKVRSAR